MSIFMKTKQNGMLIQTQDYGPGPERSGVNPPSRGKYPALLDEFRYLWVLLTNEGIMEQETERQIDRASAVMQSL